MERLLLTGAAGKIGSVLRRGLVDTADTLRSFDRAEIPGLAANEEALRGDLRDPDDVARAVADVEVIVHLAGVPVEAPFAEVVEHNILGTHQLLEAARHAGVRRVVFASTNHVVGFHPTARRLDAGSPPRPDTYYGVSKLADEGLLSLYADKFGLEAVSVRIGSCLERPVQRRHLATWLSHRDAVHLFEVCATAPLTGHLVVYGVSANTRSRWDNQIATDLGYTPTDDAERFLDEVERLDPPGDADLDDPAEHHHGGEYVGWNQAAYGPR